MNGFELILPFLKPIEHLILDDSITELMVNGPDHVFVEKEGFLQEVPGVSLGERSLMVAVKNLARRLGDDVSEAKPILDSRLPDGSRVAAVIPPCSLTGVMLTICKLKRASLAVSVVFPDPVPPLTSRLPDERILLIEDTAEIRRFEARREQSGVPGVSIRDLLKASLRHRPDRILLREIRGGEAFDLLQLVNTGHSGTLSTIHANSAKRGLARFASCVLQSRIDLPYRAVKANIADSLHVVVLVERRPRHRFISEVLEINSYDADADLFDYCILYAAKREEL
jgi:pilus assembly protein CpaF